MGKNEIQKKESKELMETEMFNLSVLDKVKEIMEDEMDGLTATFDRIKIPSGGGISFEIPGDDPDNPDTTKEILGVIVDKYPVNAYWKDSYSGQNNPPDCSALDGKNGIGKPGGKCENCPYNVWGSDEDGGKGKACKNLYRIYLLRDGEAFPLLITLPPTSRKNISNYMVKRVVGKGFRSTDVITKITLKKAVSNDGISYSQAFFSVYDVLPENVAEKLASYAKGMRDLTRTLDVQHDEYKEEDGNPAWTKDDGSDLPI